jgi:lambda family phage portal protein
MTVAAWLDRVTMPWAPRWTFQRQRARVAAAMLVRHYEAASGGRRTQGWSRPAGDPNAATLSGLSRLRDQARDLVRNNPWATSALDTLVDDVVGWGLAAKRPAGAFGPRWKAWAETTACDADGRADLPGLQDQVMRTVVEAGEALIRRRVRRLSDGFPIPLQLQVLEPDYLDTSRHAVLPSGGRIIQGVEFDAIGRRAAYWLFREHPGASQVYGLGALTGVSDRIPASEILHVWRTGRPGQVRGVSWFAPVMLRLKDFDDYDRGRCEPSSPASALAVGGRSPRSRRRAN